MFVQVALGVWLVSGKKLVAPQFHMLYGFAGIFFIGIMYSYKSQIRPKLYLWYGAFGFFVMGLGIRAMLVGTT